MWHQCILRCKVAVVTVCTILLAASVAVAEEEGKGENASNPLAKVKNTDLRYKYLDLAGGRVNDFAVEGAYMALDTLKIKYELHYWETDLSGESENNLESFDLKAIYFPKEGKWGEVMYRLALGFDWIVDLGEESKAIGSGSDQIAPFVGVALGVKGITWIPLVQHFVDYNGEDVNQTAFRLIAMKPLPQQMWLKLDAKAPIDWENDQAVPASAELQLGKSINGNIGIYLDGLVGIGSDRPYDWGVGAGLRFNY